MRILLVEDADRLRQTVATALRKSGYAVDQTGDGEEGLWYAQSNPYDAIVLDIMLPGLDGLTILKRLRLSGDQCPILLLTARDTVEDRVRGLDQGADDYLVKPFALDELLARIKALCRRRYHEKQPLVRIADLEIDMGRRRARRGGVALALPPREYRLLEYLALRRDQVVTREEIWRHIYDERSEPLSNAVDSAICSLRKKIDPAGAAPLLQTRRGLGYVLGEEKPHEIDS